MTFRPPVREFALTMVDVDGAEAVPLPAAGPRTAICLDGAVELVGPTGRTPLPQGRSVFVGHDAGAVTVEGDGLVACGWTP